MTDLQIKSESLPQRCDVCHQSDHYDPINNYCLRCINIPKQEDSEPVIDQNQVQTRLWNAENFLSKYGHIIFLITLVVIIPRLYFRFTDDSNGVIKTWYISLISFLIWIPTTVFNIRKINNIREQIGGTIRSSKDLNILKQAINFNMKAAIYLGICILIYIILIEYLVHLGFLDTKTCMLHLLIFGLITGVFSVINRKYDRSIKTLKVESNDPKILETYERWIKQWSEFRFKLPD